MPFLHDAVHNPRKLFLRKALFQIHLWSGIFLSVYVIVIALTGSILVFENELTRTTLPAHLSAYDPAHLASIPTVMDTFARAYPVAHVTDLYTPWPTIPVYTLDAVTSTGSHFTLIADPATAVLHLQPRTWVQWIHDLHVLLLLSPAYGEQVNAIGAAILLLLCITGIFLWWQGIARWSRALTLSLRSNWRRINFDLHHAIGFWTLFIVIWWSLSGVYFGFYRPIVAAVNALSPLNGMASPSLPSTTPAGPHRASLQSILDAAQQASPQGRLFSISDPSLLGTSAYAQMDLRDPADFSHRDIIAVSTVDARVLTDWHYGANHSVGDWFLWSMHPLHFGTLWGLPIKILWFLLGLSLAVLTATGLVMYWNRYLRRKIKKFA
jgi:uncharacterized iron-regulated membrane protein